MALLTSDMPNVDMKNLPAAVKKLYDYVYHLREELEYVTENLDSQNVTSIDTNETKVKSADGSTEIIGNILTMTDTKRKRLLMGYDKVYKRFQFEMYDANKVKTLYMDDDGQIQLTGKPLLKMYDNNSVVRAMLGYDKALGKFVFELNGPSGVHAIYFDDAGEAVFAGNVKTTKDIYVGNNIYMNATTYDGKGIYMTPATWIKYVGLHGMSIESDKDIKVFSGAALNFRANNGISFTLFGGDMLLPLNSYLGNVTSSKQIATMGDITSAINTHVATYHTP